MMERIALKIRSAASMSVLYIALCGAVRNSAWLGVKWCGGDQVTSSNDSARTTQLSQAPERIERAAARLIARGLSPEQYAGLRGANVLLFSLHKYRYADSKVSDYIWRLGKILDTPEMLEECQLMYKDPEADALESEQHRPVTNEAGSPTRPWRRRRRPPAS
jgi:hypothetical protein